MAPATGSISLHQILPSVALGHAENFARNLKLPGVRIEEQLGTMAEIPALFVQDKVITDPVGAVIQIFANTTDNDLLTISSEQPQQARYLGTPLGDAQHSQSSTGSQHSAVLHLDVPPQRAAGFDRLG